MRVHLVHAHPEPNSFVAAMRDVVAGELTAQGAEVTVSDLYASGFNPIASSADFLAPTRADYLCYGIEQRNAHATGTLAPDIEAEVQRVLAADVLAFTFPVFWFGPPAMLKGWIERVFLAGRFYRGRHVYGRGGLAGKQAFAAFSLGGRAHMFGPHGLHGELEQGMLRHFLQGTLGYVGLAVRQPFVAYHVPYVVQEERSAMLDALAAHVRSLSDQPFLPMPDLGGFDDSFAPLQAGA